MTKNTPNSLARYYRVGQVILHKHCEASVFTFLFHVLRTETFSETCIDKM